MSSQLDAIKARAEARSNTGVGMLAYSDVYVLVAAEEAVLELHKPEPEPNTMTWEGRYLCSQCVYIDDRGEPSAESYPCPTVQAIQSALGEGEK